MSFKEFYNSGGLIKLYRGLNKFQVGGNYYSTDREWSRQFTQSGLDSEIEEIEVGIDEILRLDPLPKATDVMGMDKAIKIGKEGGYRGIFVDEGKGQPESVFIFKGGI